MGLQDTASIDMEKHRHKDDCQQQFQTETASRSVGSVGSVGSVRLPGGTVAAWAGVRFSGVWEADFACQSSINASQQATRCGVEWSPTWSGCGKMCGKGSVWRAWLIRETHENRAGSQIANVSSEVTMECEILILWRGGGEGADAAGPDQAPPERGRGGRTHHTTRGHQHQGTPGGCQRLEWRVDLWWGCQWTVRIVARPSPRCVGRNLGMHQGRCGH